MPDVNAKLSSIEASVTNIAKEVSKLLEYGISGVATENTNNNSSVDILSFVEQRYFYSSDARYVGLPILYLDGDFSRVTKENKIDIAYKYGNKVIGYRVGVGNCKWQGNSSLAYPKKNFTINKLSPKIDVGWGSENKYVLKANFTDSSMSLNVVMAQLWGEIVKSRTDTDYLTVQLKQAPNCGAIDGFPIILYVNNTFHGLYTLNIPKDKWLFNMGSGSGEYAVASENNGTHEYKNFYSPMTAAFFNSETCYSVVYAPDEDNIDPLVSSFNTMGNSIVSANGSAFKTQIANYVNINSFIDFYIFNVLIANTDAWFSNYILFSYDGTKWGISAYDLDGVFCHDHMGLVSGRISFGSNFKVVADDAKAGLKNKLFGLIYDYDKSSLKARYYQLRNTVLSEDNVFQKFVSFIGKIPAVLYVENDKKWNTQPATSMNGLDYYMNWYRLRCQAMDAEIAAL